MTATSAGNASFTAALSVDQAPDEVFHAINNARGWWSEDIEGDTDKTDAEFTYRYQSSHRCRIKVTELVPGERIAWHVLDNYFDFTQDKAEWKDTEIYFEIEARDGRTEIRFTHVGLVPEDECFDVCSNSWDFYLYTSLRALIRTGHGLPNRKEEAASA
jgi:Activator of Hsp90 ATPase homolog 1-like protein